MTGIYKSDIDGWYSRLNAILKKHSLSTITAPTIVANQSGVTVSRSQPLINKLNSMKSDKYYSYATYKDMSNIKAGNVVKLSDKKAIEDTLSSIEATVVCRNDATYSYGTNENGDSYESYENGYSDETYENGDSYETNENGDSFEDMTNGDYYYPFEDGDYNAPTDYYEANNYEGEYYFGYDYSTDSNGYSYDTNWDGYDYWGSYENGDSNTTDTNGVKTNGTVIDVSNSNTTKTK